MAASHLHVRAFPFERRRLSGVESMLVAQSTTLDTTIINATIFLL